MFEAGAAQVLAVIRYAKAQPFVDPARGVLVGQSVGGAITLALAAKNIEGVRRRDQLRGRLRAATRTRIPKSHAPKALCAACSRAYGAKSKIPTLWLYSENDRYWGKDNPHAWFEGFRAHGGAAEFVQLPPYRNDGHASFVGNPDAWKPAVEKFLGSIGFAN